MWSSLGSRHHLRQHLQEHMIRGAVDVHRVNLVRLRARLIDKNLRAFGKTRPQIAGVARDRVVTRHVCANDSMTLTYLFHERQQVGHPHATLVPVGNGVFSVKHILIDGEIDGRGFDARKQMVDEILLAKALYGFPAESAVCLLKTLAGAIVPFDAARGMMVRVELEQPSREERQVGAFRFRAPEIMAAYAESDEFFDLRMLEGAVDP